MKFIKRAREKIIPIAQSVKELFTKLKNDIKSNDPLWNIGITTTEDNPSASVFRKSVSILIGCALIFLMLNYFRMNVEGKPFSIKKLKISPVPEQTITPENHENVK